MLDAIFSAANGLALLGWLCLLGAHRKRWANWWLTGVAIPSALALLYLALMVSSWGAAQGGFDSLAGVAMLFGSPPLLLAGWVHYLAFDLFIGSCEVRDARRLGIHHLLVIPCLAFTFMLGPVGLLAYLLLRFAARGQWMIDDAASVKIAN